MVIIEQEKEIKLVTDKQNILLAKLLESSCFTKVERDNIVNSVAGKLITSYDTSILLAHLLAKIRFQKYFNGNRKHKIAHCFHCSTKLCLKRYENLKTGLRVWLCSYCSKTSTDTDLLLVPKRQHNNHAVWTEAEIAEHYRKHESKENDI